MCRSIRQRGKVEPIFIGKNEELIASLSQVVSEDDVVLMQGAGSIGKMVKQVLEQYQQ